MDCAARGIGTPCVVNPTMRRCGLCGVVSYCSSSHQKSHWNAHKEECSRLADQIRRADSLNDFPFSFSDGFERRAARCVLLKSMNLHNTGLWRCECSCGSSVYPSRKIQLDNQWHIQSSHCPCTEPRDLLSSTLSSWEQYYKWRQLPLTSPVSIALHWPLTIYHCLQLSITQHLVSDIDGVVRIHYLGPEKELCQLPVFGELHALFPAIKLKMELVGPEIPTSSDGQEINLHNYLCCSDEGCSCKNSCRESSSGQDTGLAPWMTLKFRKGFYHERHKEMDSHPHIIIAPNAGVSAYSSWLETLELIKDMDIPAFFTDYCEEAANLAAKCVVGVTGRPLRFPIQVNPFRQPLMVAENVLLLPCYSNCFVFGV